MREGKADTYIGWLQDAWLDLADNWTPPPEVPDGYVRPFAFNSWSGYDDGGIASTWIDQVARRGGAVQVDQQLLRHLLFCHSIALPDPLFRTPDDDTTWPRWTDPDGLAAAIETVHRLRELIDQDIVVTVPRQGGILPEAAITIGDDAADLLDPPPADWHGMATPHVVATDYVDLSLRTRRVGVADNNLAADDAPTPARSFPSPTTTAIASRSS